MALNVQHLSNSQHKLEVGGMTLLSVVLGLPKLFTGYAYVLYLVEDS